MSLIPVKNIIVVTYCSKSNRLSLSLITVNETPLITQPYSSLHVFYSPLRWVQPNGDCRDRRHRRFRQSIQKSILPEGGDPEQVQDRRDETGQGVFLFCLFTSGFGVCPADDWCYFAILYMMRHTHTCVPLQSFSQLNLQTHHDPSSFTGFHRQDQHL